MSIVMIEIKGCSIPSRWYNGQTGKVFNTVPIHDGFMLIQDSGPMYRIVSSEDVIVRDVLDLDLITLDDCQVIGHPSVIQSL